VLRPSQPVAADGQFENAKIKAKNAKLRNPAPKEAFGAGRLP